MLYKHHAQYSTNIMATNKRKLYKILQYDSQDFLIASPNVFPSLFKIQDKVPKMTLKIPIHLWEFGDWPGIHFYMAGTNARLVKWVTACSWDVLKVLWTLTSVSRAGSCTVADFSGPLPAFACGFTRQPRVLGNYLPMLQGPSWLAPFNLPW